MAWGEACLAKPGGAGRPTGPPTKGVKRAYFCRSEESNAELGGVLAGLGQK